MTFQKPWADGAGHKKKRLIEGQAKCRNLCRIWSPTQPHTPPPYTRYLCIQYTWTHREGGGGEGEGGGGRGGGRVESERRLEGQQFTKLDRKYQHD
jgi:hypothetical protein